jgi:GNAT superfamily N-acetyltransferase
MAFVKVPPHARAAAAARGHRFAAYPRCSTPSAGVGVDARLVTAGLDLDEVRRLFREYAEWVAVDLSFQDFATELAELPGSYVAPRGTLLLCTIDDAIAGCIGVREWQGESCEMKRLYVRPGFRGVGAGRFLAERAISWAGEAGYRRMLLDTLRSMGSAQQLYELLGFREIPAYRLNPVPGARYMSRELGNE